MVISVNTKKNFIIYKISSLVVRFVFPLQLLKFVFPAPLKRVPAHVVGLPFVDINQKFIVYKSQVDLQCATASAVAF